MKEVLAFLIIGLMIIIVPMTITILYTRMLYNHSTQDIPKPMVVFGGLLGVEIIYLLFLYITH